MTAPAAGEDHERADRSQGVNSGAMRAVTRYLRRNRSLLVGLALLFGIIAFAVIGGLFVDPQNARPLSARPLQPPSWALPFGSDRQGRNLFAVITSGTLLTLRVGLIAGGLGVTTGAALAFVSAYYGGWVDTVLRSIVDVGLTVPNLMVLIVVAMMLREGMTVDVMALVIASLAWLYPARTIRSQVLTLRERAYVEIARLSGVSGPGIIVKEILPNLLPYLMASLVGSVSAAILAWVCWARACAFAFASAMVLSCSAAAFSDFSRARCASSRSLAILPARVSRMFSTRGSAIFDIK